MAEQVLPNDFREFLKLLNENDVAYLLIGGYAVAFYGYPRTTADIDIWVDVSPDNASKLVNVFASFGMNDSQLGASLFLDRGKIVRMGLPPMRIEVLTDIDGVEFAECYDSRVEAEIDGVRVNLIARNHLIENKKASARHKDLDDIENIPDQDLENK